MTRPVVLSSSLQWQRATTRPPRQVLPSQTPWPGLVQPGQARPATNTVTVTQPQLVRTRGDTSRQETISDISPSVRALLPSISAQT